MHLRIAVSLVLLTAIGCSGGEVDVEGRVYFGDEAVVPVSGQTMRVILEVEDPLGEASKSVGADLDRSGQFRFSGLPPGRYVVTVYDYPAPQRGDRLASAFAGGADPIVMDIDGSKPLAVRLPKEWAPSASTR